MKILNFGSLNYDLCYDVPHFTRAGETQSSTSFTRNLGGKGFNQSIAMSRAGLSVYHAGAVGTDGSGLTDYLLENNVDTSLIKIDQETATGHAVIQIAGADNCILLYGGANQNINARDIDHVLSGFSKGDMLILQNEVSNLPLIMEKAHALGMVIVFNAAPMNENVLRCPLQYVDLLIVNEIEGRDLARSSAESMDTLAYVLASEFPDQQILLTSGAEGSRYISEGEITFCPSLPVTPVDTTGAGDTFTGFFLAAENMGYDIPRALQYATAAAAISITRHGAAVSIPTSAEVEAYLAQKK